MEQDIYWLKKKIGYRAEYAVTQMFYETTANIWICRKGKKEGINVPIIPGIKPFRKLSQLNMIPKTFKIDSGKRSDEIDEEAESLGIEWCIHQCRINSLWGSQHSFLYRKCRSVKEAAKAIY